MRFLSKALVLFVGVIALYSVQACTAGVPEADLNPQPLPPAPGENDPSRGPASDESDKNGGSMVGTGGGTSPASPASDAGAEGGDAADGGDR